MARIRSTDGVSLAVHDLGGDGPPLLLCHATGFHGLVWRPFAATLLDTFHCWSLDFRGPGDSAAPDSEYAWEGFADDVLAVVDGFGLADDRPYGIGHSKGGASLLLAEERRPGTFRALWLYEPVVFAGVAPAPPPGENPMAAGARRRREVFDSHDAAYENYASKPPLDVLRPDALRAYVDHGFASQEDGTVLITCRGETEARVYTMGARHHAYDGLDEVRCPVTIARGRIEPGPATFADAVSQRLPAGRLEVFDDLGHFGPMEDPDRLAAAARAFLLASRGA